MFEIMLRASSERYSSGIGGFSYAIVMTKSDKTSSKVLQASIHDVRRTVADIAQRLVVDDNPGYPVPVVSSDDDAIHIGSDEEEEEEEEDPDGTMISRSVGLQEHLRHMLSCVEVLSTSSVSKEGADDVWRVIQKAVFRR
jgi:GTP-binding protein EngB required for normal cell division